MAPTKLTDDDKQTIIQLYRQPEETTSTLAERYGVSNSTISRLLKATLPETEYGALIQQKRAAATDKGAAAPPPPSKGKSKRQTKGRKQEKPKAKAEKAKAEKAKDEKTKGKEAKAEKAKGKQTKDEKAKAEKAEATPLPREAETPTPKSKPIPKAEKVVTSPSPSEEPAASAKPEEPKPATPETSRPKPIPKQRRAAATEQDEGTQLPLLEEEQTDAAEPAAIAEDFDLEEDATEAAALDAEDLSTSRDEDFDDDDEDFDDEDEDDFEDEDDSPDSWEAPIHKPRSEEVLHIMPLEDAVLPQLCYVVVERTSGDLVTCPLRDFSELGRIPEAEVDSTTLPVFDNHRVARRFTRRNQRVIKVPDGSLLQTTRFYLQAKGITRLLIDGQVYALEDEEDPALVTSE